MKEQAAWIHVVDKIKSRLLGIKPPKELNHYTMQLWNKWRLLNWWVTWEKNAFERYTLKGSIFLKKKLILTKMINKCKTIQMKISRLFFFFKKPTSQFPHFYGNAKNLEWQNNLKKGREMEHFHKMTSGHTINLL